MVTEDEELEEVETPLLESDFAGEFEGEEDDVDDDLDSTHLSTKQKLIVGLTVLAFTLVFTVVFLPLESLARYFIQNNVKQGQVDFSEIKLSVFGQDKIKDLTYDSRGTSFSAGSLKSTMSLLGLLSQELEGDLRFTRLSLSTETFGLTAKSAGIDSDLVNIMESANKWLGNLRITAKGAAVVKLPPALVGRLKVFSPGAASFLEQPGGLKIKNLRLDLKIPRGGQMLLKGKAAGNLFETIELNGSARVSKSIGSPNLDAKLCLTPAKNLKEINESIFNMITLISSAGGKLCLTLKGVPGTNDFMNNLQKSLVPGGGGDGAPTPAPGNTNPGGESEKGSDKKSTGIQGVNSDLAA